MKDKSKSIYVYKKVEKDLITWREIKQILNSQDMIFQWVGKERTIRVELSLSMMME